VSSASWLLSHSSDLHNRRQVSISRGLRLCLEIQTRRAPLSSFFVSNDYVMYQRLTLNKD